MTDDRSSLFERLDASVAFSPEEAMLLDAVRAVARKEIAPRAEHHDRTGEFPAANVAAINRLGLNAMFVPEAYGGTPLSYTAYLACVREISMACASTGIIWATNFHAMKPVIDFASAEQKHRFLPRIAAGGLAALAITEPEAGSDATGMSTRFRPEGNEIAVTGGKNFITNGDVADLYLVFGKWSEIDDPKRAISALILEKGTPGLKVLRLEDKLGHRASSTAALAFESCRAPRANLIGEPGSGLPLLLASLNKSRPSVAAHALGIARGAFEDAVCYINQRRQSGRRIIEFQGVQFLLADLASELAMAESWLWHVARLVDSGAGPFAVEASILKLRASDIAMRIATEAVQLLGGYGYCKDYRVERLFRDAKITQIWEGTNQIHRQLIGRSFIELIEASMTEIKTVGVAGSGTMGAGIAIVAARAGFRTIVFDLRADTLERARRQTEGFFAKSVERGKLSAEQVENILSGLTGTTRIEDLAPCDIVIEAVFENLAVKHEPLAKLDKICRADAIFASNTSTLSISEIAAGSGRDDRVVGMHFCLPAQLMKLVEMSPGLRTTEETFEKAWRFCTAMGQRPVRTKDHPGFILNAVLVPFNNDAIRLVESGVAAPAEIDRAIKAGLGYPMGPLELIDLIGLDTQLLLCEALHGVTHDPRAACPPLVRRMIAANHLGRKSGQGFYRYYGDTMFGG